MRPGLRRVRLDAPADERAPEGNLHKPNSTATPIASAAAIRRLS